jgi:hypothetical protein
MLAADDLDNLMNLSVHTQQRYTHANSHLARARMLRSIRTVLLPCIFSPTLVTDVTVESRRWFTVNSFGQLEAELLTVSTLPIRFHRCFPTTSNSLFRRGQTVSRGHYRLPLWVGFLQAVPAITVVWKRKSLSLSNSKGLWDQRSLPLAGSGSVCG